MQIGQRDYADKGMALASGGQISRQCKKLEPFDTCLPYMTRAGRLHRRGSQSPSWQT
jgi:hypothetical protein